MQTKYNLFKIFNYETKKNKIDYYSDTDGGENQWFFEPLEYKSKKPYSYAHQTRKHALKEASLLEVEILLKIHRKEIKKQNRLYDNMRMKIKDRQVSVDIPFEISKVEDFYTNCILIIKDNDIAIKELLEWRDDLNSYKI